MSSGTVTLENILAIPQRTKHGVMYYPEIPLIGIWPQLLKTYIHTKIVY